MLRVSWLAWQSNEIVLEKAGAHRSVTNVITKRRMYFLAIYVEKKSLEIKLAQERLKEREMMADKDLSNLERHLTSDLSYMS